MKKQYFERIILYKKQNNTILERCRKSASQSTRFFPKWLESTVIGFYNIIIRSFLHEWVVVQDTECK